MKVLLDTDPGSDIDDAVCIAYLLANPDCDLLGITTVTGEGEKRACIADALCRVAGIEVPIHVGAEEPIIVPQRQATASQAVALVKWEHGTGFPRGEAVEFMRQTIRAHPGEVVLLAIGPLTNVALLFLADPEIPSLLKGLVLMGGAFDGCTPEEQTGEWNIMLDPHAAAVVYRSGVRIHRSVGLDVTLQVTMDAEEVKSRFQAPLLRPVLDFAQVWFSWGMKEMVFHDPLAAATLFDEEICTFDRGVVSVELDDRASLGTTRFTPGTEGAPHEVAVAVDRDRFVDHYFGVFA
ncbi:MAG: nucleoside hydrolase [Planctomycetota bacterium]|jgi:inosine-uridine nucleoside N-ribohydrolase